jgi:hypothetical protein
MSTYLPANVGKAVDDMKPVAPQVSRRYLPPGVPTKVDLESPWHVEDEILEEFEFDHELTWKFHAEAEKCGTLLMFFPGLVLFAAGMVLVIVVTLATLAVPIVGGLSLFGICGYCFIDANAADSAYCRWVAVSQDNVYIVRKKRGSGCRCSCTDIGETRKLIPIANIQDVMISEPAGTAVCCFVPNVLTGVHIQTAAAGGGPDPQSEGSQGYLLGLKDPRRFRDVVMALKKGRYVGKSGESSAFTPIADSLSGVIRGIEAGSADSAATPAIVQELRGIRELLSKVVEVNSTEVELMRSMNEKLSLLPKQVSAV